MAKGDLTKKLIKQIDAMVAAYSSRRHEFSNFAGRVERDLVENQKLRSLIHSTKRREKDPKNLRDKLIRKAHEAKQSGKTFGISTTNIFQRLDDLAGVRLLHIHMEQLEQIHPCLLEIFAFHKYELRERPVAYIWDVERKVFLERLGLKTVIRPSLYTSVHYVVQPHFEAIGCEIQVRTLAEELWGEVSHTINYPHPTASTACREQLAALARVASGCTRLVDSIFRSREEHKKSLE